MKAGVPYHEVASLLEVGGQTDTDKAASRQNDARQAIQIFGKYRVHARSRMIRKICHRIAMFG